MGLILEHSYISRFVSLQNFHNLFFFFQPQPSQALPQRSPLGPGQTYASFDNATVIQCSGDSPFVFCSGRPAMRTPAEKVADAARHRPWKIADVRRAKWQAETRFDNCRYSNCVNVGNRPGPDTDVVHVYGVGLNGGFPRPVRHPNQMWLYSVWESPHHTHADFLSSEFIMTSCMSCYSTCPHKVP